jgi:hypothetical protein
MIIAMTMNSFALTRCDVIASIQVIDNVAMVIMEESEFGEQNYYFWYQIFILLDLVCCMCIIFPIIWYISHRIHSHPMQYLFA